MAAMKATPPIAIPTMAPVERVDPDDEFADVLDIPVSEEVKVVEDEGGVYTVAEPDREAVVEDDGWEVVVVGGSCSTSTIDDRNILSPNILPPSLPHLPSYYLPVDSGHLDLS